MTRIDPLAEPIKHVFTHRVWLLWPCRADADLSDGSGTVLTAATHFEWIAPGERPTFGGIPTVTERLLERLGYEPSSGPRRYFAAASVSKRAITRARSSRMHSRQSL